VLDVRELQHALRPVGGVSVPVPSSLALNGPFDFVGRPTKMLAAERFCRPIEETMDAVANELERIRRSHPRRIPSVGIIEAAAGRWGLRGNGRFGRW